MGVTAPRVNRTPYRSDHQLLLFAFLYKIIDLPAEQIDYHLKGEYFSVDMDLIGLSHGLKGLIELTRKPSISFNTD